MDAWLGICGFLKMLVQRVPHPLGSETTSIVVNPPKPPIPSQLQPRQLLYNSNINRILLILRSQNIYPGPTENELYVILKAFPVQGLDTKEVSREEKADRKGN
ncbi:hypothetical protein ACHAPG_001045 [Botrytis cinerea]